MKVLILHASAGAGHKRAAEALAKAFHFDDAGAEVAVRDILEFTPALFRQSYSGGYLRVVQHVPELWGYMYNRADQVAQEPWQKKIRTAFNRINTGGFFKFLQEFNPDVTVCTHFMPLALLSAAAGKHRIATRVFCCVTDFAVHSLWVVEGVDCYYVASPEMRRFLARMGQPADRIETTGIPIDPVFAQGEPPRVARQRLELREGIPTLLVMSGGFGVGPTAALIRSFRETPFDCQILAVAGANERLRKEAEKAAGDLGVPVKVFGFVTNVHELMDASDLVLTKPGGLTTSEVLAKGIPMAIVDPIPGQEQRNCEYLLEAGAAIRIHEVEDAPWKIQALFGDPGRHQSMRECAARLGRPRSAFEIARDIRRRAFPPPA